MARESTPVSASRVMKMRGAVASRVGTPPVAKRRAISQSVKITSLLASNTDEQQISSSGISADKYDEQYHTSKRARIP